MKTQTEKTQADNKSIGFDFQYYYFLRRLLSLKKGESVGLEVRDDVHTELKNSRQILVQLKHTVQTKADGSPINLTQLDIDLWKSLSNWSKIINDKGENRSSIKDQLDFIERTDFLLASNKSDNEKNVFLKFVRDYKLGLDQILNIRAKLKQIKNDTENEDIQNYINDLLMLDDSVLSAFFKNIDFELGLDNIVSECKTAIREKMILENKIDDVFRNVDSQIRQDNFILIKAGQKIEISFEDFYNKYKLYFDRGRNSQLNIRPFEGVLPDNILDQTFVKQLIHIGDLEENDLETIIEYTRKKIQLENNMSNWEIDDITPTEKENFENEAIERWKNIFRSKYRGNIPESDINRIGLEVLDAIRRERLTVASTEMPTELSNGEYYHLSNVPKIGWRNDWRDKYK